jgi:hypothetical protein
MPDEVESFLETYPPKVRALALQARELVRGLVPEAEERVLRPWKTIAYGLDTKFCAISPYGSWVNLHFHRGASLPDPAGLLAGTGKSARHVRVASPADLRRRALSSLIRVAARGAQ